MLTWLANLLSGGRLDRTERRVEELERERDYAWGEFRAESERTEWQAEQHLHWRELHHRAVQLRDQAGKDLTRATRDKGTWKAYAKLHMGARDILIQKANELNRSRRGWKWLYEAKCAEWAVYVRDLDEQEQMLTIDHWIELTSGARPARRLGADRRGVAGAGAAGRQQPPAGGGGAR